MIRFLVMFLLIFLPLPAAAQGMDNAEMMADQNTGYVCNHSEFSLRRAATFSDEKARYFLTGSLQMPTPGYGYSLELDDQQFDEQHYTMVFIKPEGALPQVISPLPVEYEFIAAIDMDSMIIGFEDAENVIETQKIECKKSG